MYIHFSIKARGDPYTSLYGKIKTKQRKKAYKSLRPLPFYVHAA